MNRFAVCFVNEFKFQETSPNSSKGFLGNNDNINKRRFLGKANGHNDHYMINMGRQRLKINSN